MLCPPDVQIYKRRLELTTVFGTWRNYSFNYVEAETGSVKLCYLLVIYKTKLSLTSLILYNDFTNFAEYKSKWINPITNSVIKGQTSNAKIPIYKFCLHSPSIKCSCTIKRLPVKMNTSSCKNVVSIFSGKKQINTNLAYFVLILNSMHKMINKIYVKHKTKIY